MTPKRPKTVDECDLGTLDGRIHWARLSRGDTNLSLAKAAGLDPTRFARPIVRLAAKDADRISAALRMNRAWLIEAIGNPWPAGEEPLAAISKDGRTRAAREGQATDVDVALDDYPFDDDLDYYRARALAAVDLVKLHRWKPGRVMKDVNLELRFHTPQGTTDREIANGIVETMLQARGEHDGTRKVVDGPEVDPALPPKPPTPPGALRSARGRQ